MKKSPLTVIITVLLFGTVFVQSAYANSARRHWQGTDATGALTANKDCPIVVDKEILTFDVQEFPKNYYNSAEEFLAYTGKVTAEYTFRNPADYTVTATLVFPFGNLPHYGEYFYDSPTDKYTSASDTEKYGVTVDGKQIEAAVRHTLKGSGTPFSLDTDMSKLSDGYISDAFFSPELPVWMQQYSVEGVNADNQSATAAFVLSEDPSKTRMLWEEKSGADTLKDGFRLSGWVKNGDTLTVYIFGEIPKDGIKWILYENGACKKIIDGSITLKYSEQISFRDFVFREYDKSSGISEIDWYNAQVTFLNAGSEEWRHGGIYTEKHAFSLMRWYEYTLTFEPGQTLTNTVTAPLYPSVDTGYTLSVYEYTYLLSPAKMWAQFGELKIGINTPYFMIESNQGNFTKTENGYEMILPGLPEKELVFTLAEAENPQPQKELIQKILLPVAAGIALLISSITAAAVVMIIKKRKQ